LRQFVSSMSFLPFLPTVFCPVSPSLWWVPWALVPHSLDPSNTRVLSYFVVTLYKVIGTMLHYDCHQPISRRFAFWLADVIPDQLPRFVSRPRRLARRRKQPAGNKALGHPVPFIFRESFIRKLMALPSSRVTPLTTCPALRPRWSPAYSPVSLTLVVHRTAAFRCMQSVGFGYPHTSG
jgi:hypothetical protein